MTESLRPDLDARLHREAVDFILPAGSRVDVAVAVAEDFVATGCTGVATVEVAALSRAASLSDAEPRLRAMLAEHGIAVPDATDEQSEYRVLLYAFGYWDLPIHFFEGRSTCRFRRGRPKAPSIAPSSPCWTNATTRRPQPNATLSSRRCVRWFGLTSPLCDSTAHPHDRKLSGVRHAAE